MLTETFSLFTDAELTEEFDGDFDLVHFTDLSDGAQTMLLYLGSLGSGGSDTNDRQLQDADDPGTNDVIISVNYLLPIWVAGHVYSVGDCIKPTGVNYVMRCTIAGTSHATTEPNWGTMGGMGSFKVDNTVTWKKAAARHPTSEIKLATTNGGLSGATPGASLNIGDTILSGITNAQPIYIRVTNTVTSVYTNTSHPELALAVNSLVEREVT